LMMDTRFSRFVILIMQGMRQKTVKEQALSRTITGRYSQ
jgi:hypothetical protein